MATFSDFNSRHVRRYKRNKKSDYMNTLLPNITVREKYIKRSTILTFDNRERL